MRQMADFTDLESWGGGVFWVAMKEALNSGEGGTKAGNLRQRYTQNGGLKEERRRS